MTALQQSLDKSHDKPPRESTESTESTPHPEAKFWDRIAERYSKKPVPDQAVYEEKLGKTDALLRPTDQVLEIGCGTGTTAIHHAPKVAHLRATDLSAEMINIARNKASDAGVSNVDFDVASVDSLYAEKEAYDVVLAHSILHLLPDVDGVLKELHTMLKPGGLLISTTACIKDILPIFRFIGPIGRKLGLMPYVNVFGAADLESWIQDAGFEIEERWLPGKKRGIYIVARKAA